MGISCHFVTDLGVLRKYKIPACSSPHFLFLLWLQNFFLIFCCSLKLHHPPVLICRCRCCRCRGCNTYYFTMQAIVVITMLHYLCYNLWSSLVVFFIWILLEDREMKPLIIFSQGIRITQLGWLSCWRAGTAKIFATVFLNPAELYWTFFNLSCSYCFIYRVAQKVWHITKAYCIAHYRCIARSDTHLVNRMLL